MLTKIKDTLSGKAPLSAKRSRRWPAHRKIHLLGHPTCAVCGGKEKLEVHHILPFHLHPELELEPSNLITLCESKKNGVVCHLFAGHLGSYKKFNPTVKEDAEYWRKKLTE